MTLVTCCVCGRRAHKKDRMLVTARGNAYCLDEEMCELRKEKRAAEALEAARVEDERSAA